MTRRRARFGIGIGLALAWALVAGLLPLAHDDVWAADAASSAGEKTRKASSEGKAAAREGGADAEAEAAAPEKEAPPDPALRYDLVYEAQILPDHGVAQIQIRVDQSRSLLEELRLAIEPKRHLRFRGDGEVSVEGDQAVWKVPPRGGVLRYTAQIDHLREPTEYDARSTRTWALFRGSDLFPRSSSTFANGAHSRARLHLRVPPDWDVVVPFERKSDGAYAVEQRDRRLDRPAGWFLLGDLDVTRAEIEGMEIVVASPDAHDLHQRDIVALMRWTLPELKRILGSLPPRIVVVGADDPMWRGGLSGPGSLYLHADRPLIEWDGTSPVLHEVVHVLTHAASGEKSDWIVEGLAEYYSIELLARSGTLAEEELAELWKLLERRGRRAETLVGASATGDVTARAVTVMRDLDEEIREATDGERGLDQVLRRLHEQEGVVTLERFQETAEAVAGTPLDAFFRRHLK